MTWLVSLALAATPLGYEEALGLADTAADVVAAGTAAREREAAVGALPALTQNPTLLLQPALRTEAGVARPEGQLSLSQGFNLAGLAGSRHEVAVREADQARALAVERRWQRRVEVSRAWLDAWAAGAAAAAAGEEARGARELAARLARAEPAGGATRADVASARAFAAEAHATALAWEGRVVDAGAALAMLLGLGELARVSADAPALAPAALPEPGRRRPPHLRLLEAQAAAAAARALEAAAQWGTSLQLSLSGAHEAPTQWLAGVGVGLTLPLFERGQAEVASQRVLATRLGGEAGHAERRFAVELQLLEHELAHTLEVYEAVHGEQLPQALEAARLEGRRFEQGECTLQDLLLVRRAALSARTAALLAEAELLAARARARELELVLGSDR